MDATTAEKAPKLYRIYDGGEQHWVVAHSPQEAEAFLSESWGFDLREEYGDAVETTEVDPAATLEVGFEDPDVAEEEWMDRYEIRDGIPFVEATAQAWIENAIERERVPGIVASSVW